MSILFSNVRLKSDYGEKKFLVRGVPTYKDDITHYTAYRDYLSSVKENTEIDAHADAYLYGGGGSVDATIEEVAYMKMRMDKDPEFLSRCCTKVFDSDFSFWTDDDPDESEDAGQALLVGRIGFLDSRGNIGETLDFTDEYITNHFVVLQNKLGLKRIRYHDLRHTFASLLLKNQKPLIDVSNFLGHSDISTTANIYAHLDISTKQGCADLISSILDRKEGAVGIS